MTVTATPEMAQSLHEIAPEITTQVRDGHLAKAQTGLLAVGGLLAGLGYVLGEHGSLSYLVGYMGTLGICLGTLFFTMIQHITSAGWSVTLRRLTENTAATLPFMLLLFLPIVIGFHDIYHHWTDESLNITDPNGANYDAVLAGKSGYLNPTFFFIRVVLYFAVWIVLATYFRNQSIKQDQSGDPEISLHLRRVAAPGLLLFALTTTFASFDWIMSIDPHWFSTIFGVVFFAGSVMTSMAFVILMSLWLMRKGYYHGAITVEHFHDVGKLMWAFMLFWTYTSFSQYMLIWYANLPEETVWYELRTESGWGAIGPVLIVGHFAFPFVFLMSRNMKRNTKILPIGAVLLMMIHCVDMQYLILPSGMSGHDHGHGHGHGGDGGLLSAAAGGDHGHAHGFGAQIGEYLHTISWADFGCFIGLACLVAGFTLRNIRGSNLVPLRDPRLREALNFHNI